MIIQFGIINLKISLILLIPFILSSRKLFSIDNEEFHPLYKVFIDYLGYTFFGIIFLLSKLSIKSEKEIKKEKKQSKKNKELNLSFFEQLSNSNENLKKNKLKRQRRKKIIFIIILTELQMLGLLVQYFFKREFDYILSFSLMNVLQLIFFIIFSLLFLNYTLYLHQYISFIIYFFCIMIILFQSIIYRNSLTILTVFQLFLYSFVIQKTFCFCDVIGKKYLNLYMDGIYLMLFKIGITGLVQLLFYDSIAYFYGFNDKYHGIIKTILSDFNFLPFIIDLIYNIIFYFGMWLTIDSFSPCHYIILDSLSYIIKIIISFFKSKKGFYAQEQIITFYILFPIIIFCSFIFNEVIILNFCGLNKNTKLYIMDRAPKDMDNEINEEFEIDDKYFFDEESSYY